MPMLLTHTPPGVIFVVVQLMQLQSRFGTDERFKMDARFLEDGEDPKGEKGEAPQQVALFVHSKVLFLS